MTTTPTVEPVLQLHIHSALAAQVRVVGDWVAR